MMNGTLYLRIYDISSKFMEPITRVFLKGLIAFTIGYALIV